MLAYLDAHCHLADPRLKPRLEEVLARARDRGVTRFIQGGVGPEDWARQRELSQRFPGQILPVFGLHPWWVAEHGDGELEPALTELAQALPGAIALGELGLDYGRRGPTDTHLRQERAFRLQLRLARRTAKPLVLHIVRAHGPAIEILQSEGIPPSGGIVHSYSGSAEQAKTYLSLGLGLSVGGPLLRRTADGKPFEKLQRAVVSIPEDRLLIETDSPDQPPPSRQGGLNEPVTLWEVAAEIARLRGGSAEEWLDRSRDNAARIFGLPMGRSK
jgi:TatD DNase family protein